MAPESDDLICSPHKKYEAPDSENGFHWVLSAGSILLLFCLAVFMQVRLSDMLFDDAFIHLRVARNLELHGTAIFNLGERVMTTSSPLWTVLLALLGIGGHVWALPFLEAGLLTVCGVLAYLLSRNLLSESTGSTGAAEQGMARRSRITSIMLAGIAGLLTMLLVLPSSIGQMETPLAMAFFLGAAVLFARRHGAALPLLALGACTRLELVPLFLVACVAAIWMKVSRSSVLLAVSVLAALMTAVYFQFGVILPNSMRAKAIGYAYDRTDILLQLSEARFLAPPLACCLAIYLSAVFVDQLLALRKHRLSLLGALPALAGFWGIAAMSEYVVRSTPIFEWYRPVFLLPVLICLLMYRATPASPSWLRYSLGSARFMGLPLLLLIPAWKGVMAVKAAGQRAPLAQFVVDRGDAARVQEYLVVGRTLRTTCPRGSLMTSEIGALGWAFEGNVIDAFGIATPRALAFQPLRSGAPVGGIPAAFAVELQPDIIVSYTALDVEVRGDPALMTDYELVALPPSLLSHRGTSMRSGWHGSTHLDVFLRKAGTCPVAITRGALRVALQ